MAVLNTLLDALGDTPLVRLHSVTRGLQPTVLAKLEMLNPGGSVKDRIGIRMIEDAEQRGLLRPGGTIVEPTSGNTGHGLAIAAAIRGYRCIFVMPDKMSAEKIALLRAYGAEVVITPTSVARESPESYYSVADKLASEIPGAFQPNQYFKQVNPQTHEETTGPEIWAQTEGRIDAFVAGVGTGGTIMGVGRYLRGRRKSIKIHPVEPSESPTLSTGHKVGQHRIQGVSDEFIPAIVDLNELDHVIAVNDGDAILMAQKLAAHLGLAVGISSGANFIAALIAQNELGDDAVVVTVFADSNKKYLSTDLLREEPVRDGYLSPKVSLSHFAAVRKYKDCTATCGASQ
jgi:cystathionine beta-synthase